MDLNMAIVCGTIAADPEVNYFNSGGANVRVLITTKTETPRRRVDVIPVTYWFETDEDNKMALDLKRGERIWVTGTIQRRFWSEGANRSRIEIVAHAIDRKEAEVPA